MVACEGILKTVLFSCLNLFLYIYMYCLRKNTQTTVNNLNLPEEQFLVCAKLMHRPKYALVTGLLQDQPEFEAPDFVII